MMLYLGLRYEEQLRKRKTKNCYRFVKKKIGKLILVARNIFGYKEIIIESSCHSRLSEKQSIHREGTMVRKPFSTSPITNGKTQIPVRE